MSEPVSVWVGGDITVPMHRASQLWTRETGLLAAIAHEMDANTIYLSVKVSKRLSDGVCSC